MLTRNEGVILLCGCEHETRIELEPAIRSLGFSLGIAEDAEAVRTSLQTSESEITGVIVGSILQNWQDFETVRGIRMLDPHLPVMVVSARACTEEIVNAMKCGATEFLSAPTTDEAVAAALSRALKTSDVMNGSVRLGEEEAGYFVSSNPAMAEIQALVARVGHSKVPVLIQGETGTGKEVIARAIHRHSLRSNRPFLKLNCAALPSELVESELFGYERGAFTGAFKRKEGMFELADGGTLLLDEIGDMDIRLQAKLLQVLQDREFRRIGGKETVKVDVRVIAASHRDLEQAIEDRTFREDLYYRLNVVNLTLPALRERKEDIIGIAEFLMKKHAGKEPELKIGLDLRQAMLAYHWPGNVRELENYIRKLMIFRDCGVIARELRTRAVRKQPLAVRSAEPVPQAEAAEGVSALDEARKAKEKAETEVILSALNSTHWNRKQAAALMNIDYKSLLYKMKKLGIDNMPIRLPARNEPFSRLRSATGD